MCVTDNKFELGKLDFSPKTVYHYCSVETFMKIIQNATLRATNIRKSNDYTEIINTIDVFRMATRKAMYKYRVNNPDDYIFGEFDDLVDTDELIKRAIDKATCSYYCTCFSEARDLLSQWRGYADDGRGVAIGFDDSFFIRATDYRYIKYLPIVYDLSKFEDDLINYLVKRFTTTHDTRANELTCADYETTFDLIINSMVYNAVFYKNRAFSEECERRLTYYPFSDVKNLERSSKRGDLAKLQLYYDRMIEMSQISGEHKGLKRGTIEFMARDNMVVSYIDFNFRDLLPWCIKEIVLGPKNTMDDLDLRLFLLNNGIDLAVTKITRSKATYR